MQHALIAIKVLQKTKRLQLEFADGVHFDLPIAYCRQMSPAADRQHADTPLDETQFTDINIRQVEPVGQYAVKLYFSDGYQNGIYSWDYLYTIGQKFVTK